MDNLTCQCEHCKEIIRQQDRLEKWQKNYLLKPSKVDKLTTH